MTTEEKFLAAVDVVNSLPHNGPFQPSDDLMLKFYAYYKQATVGPCSVPKPSFWEATARNRWTAWNELRMMTRKVAMENYVEELAKVIETMSYNEKVSKFISSMAPFYEVVCTDENDFHEPDLGKGDINDENQEKSTTNISTNTVSREQNVSYSPTQLNEEASLHFQPQQCIESFRFGMGISSLHRKSSTENSSTETFEERSSSSQSSDTESPCLTEEDVNEMFKKKRILKKLPIATTKDLLILTVINMQNCLEDIVKQLERIENLASTTELSKHEVKCESLSSNSWSLSLTGTAIVLLWPIAVHFCMHSIRSSLERG